MKPHIYFHRYASGLGFWRVRCSRVGPWKRPRASETIPWAKAYEFVSKLNREAS